MANHWKNFDEVPLPELNLCPNQFDLSVRSMDLENVEILVFFGVWLLWKLNKREMGGLLGRKEFFVFSKTFLIAQGTI